ncbi:MAG: membrane protein insertase YidC [Pseudohongiellaceae bacterium]
MAYTRYVLYTALAIVSYMMLLAWNTDYPPIAEVPSEIPAADLPGTDISAQSDLPVPAPAVQATPPLTNSSDLPVAQISEPVQTANESTPRLVNVTTDTLQLSIDLTGGDIARLALPKYFRQLNEEDEPFILLESSPSRIYVAESGLIGLNGIDSNNNRAVYQAQASEYQLSENSEQLVVDLLVTDSNGVQITKRFTFSRDSYAIQISYIVNNPTSTPWQANLFGQIRRGDFPDPSDVGGFGRSFLGFAATSLEDPYIKIEFEDIDEGSPALDVLGGWIAFSQHYFLTAWIPEQSAQNTFSLRRNNASQYFGTFVGPAFVVNPKSSATHTTQFYAGPTDQNQLGMLAENLNLTIDYGVLWFLASPIYWLLTHIEPVVGNYGVAIILLTLLVKGAFYKLTETQYRSMAGMRRLMPKMQQLKESYGDDKLKLQKATMDLYKKEKINPFGGCLPMLVQMPVFIALYWMLMRSVELRHAPFILWIDDLSVMDPYFVLPLLMGASMFIQTMLSPAPADPMQAKVMKFMPIMMTAFFLFFPAGLVLYWLVNSVLGIAQQWYITRKLDLAYQAKGS